MSEAVVKSAGRALAILELFERERAALPLKDVASALALPTSSAAALLKSLVVAGYLDYDRSARRYHPTMRVAALGRWVESALFGGGAVLAEARALHDETGLTVVLAVQSDLHAQYLHLLRAEEPFAAPVAPGARRPLARSGMGLALLSRQSDAAVRRLVRRLNYGAPEGERIEAAALLQRLREVRAQGFAASYDQVTPGFGLIAAPYPVAGGERPVALGVTGPTRILRVRERALVNQLVGIGNKGRAEGL